MEEKYYILKNDVDKQQNKPHFEGDPPRTLREIWNNPAILCKKPLKEAPKKQTKETPKKEKKSDALLATAQLKRHMKEVTSNMPALKRAVTAAEKITLPQVPSHFAQYGVLIPATVSKEILQRLFDLEFLFQEIVDLQELVVRERDRIRATFLIWSTAGRACWNYGKTRIFELKDMRKYEYDRVSLLSACYVVSSRYGGVPVMNTNRE